MILHTTFALARKARACPEGYKAAAKALGGVRAYGRDTPIPLLRILEIRGLSDALWCLRCVLPEEEATRDRLARLLACDYAEHVTHLWVAPPGITWTPGDTISVARRYADRQATRKELQAAWDAAWDAARAAARDAARDAAWAAARDAARAAARAAAWDAEREWQTQRLREVLV